jgi:TetR/AcrR family transcriptional regulator, mexJK operon transcriptional repressor
MTPIDPDLASKPHCYSTPPLDAREVRRVARRAAIIDVARRHFLARGYDRTSMSGIVEEMGGSKGTLWHHFASKEDLFTAVIDDVTASFRREMIRILDPARDAIEALKSLALKVILRLTAPDAVALQRLVAGEVERFPEIGRNFYERAPSTSRALLAEYLAGRMAAGELREDDPAEAAETMLNLCCGQYHQRVLLGLTAAQTWLAEKEASFAVRQFQRCYSPAFH